MKLFKNLNIDRLKESLSKTRAKIVDRINETITGKAKLDEELLAELEEILLSSDVGLETTNKIIDNACIKFKNETDRSNRRMIETIKDEMISILEKNPQDDSGFNFEKYKPYIILIVGVNGVGKTTTIGKLAYNFKQSGLSVLVASADTFRAAANEQLDIWAKRANVEIIKREAGSDPSSVVFEALEAAKNKNTDVVLVDTAGRLHTKSNLMEELKKIKKVMKRILDYAPNDTFLILDGTTGQNSLIQSRTFKEVTDISGLIITKLDGTAKGGVIFQICSSENIPVKYIGVGEDINDLQNFDPQSFVKALFDK
jgi:fused signal recognition particle receptor